MKNKQDNIVKLTDALRSNNTRKENTMNTLLKQLKQNTQVLEDTFRNAGLQLISFNFRNFKNSNNGVLLIEVKSIINSADIPENAHIKLNLYDKEDELFICEGIKLPKGKFSYDSFEIPLLYGDPFIDANSAKLYFVS